ncbi:MAG: serine hydrolase, partial [Bacteroidota bacterium]
AGSAQTDPTIAAVDALFRDSLDQVGGGAAVLILHDGEVIHRAGYGTFSTETRGPTASAAKWLSGGVIASLLSDGTLTLDDPLGDFFPSLTGPKRDITVRQLFAHTSGIASPRESGCLADTTTTLAACAERILDRPLGAAPGAVFAYGGFSMQVAGRVGEIATGKPWVELFEERIARPLGMTATTYVSATNPRVPGAMLTSIDDYGAFLQMVLDGGMYEGTRVLATDAVDAMLADQTEGAPVVFSPYQRYVSTFPVLPPADSIRYGIGVWREQVAANGSVLDAASPGASGTSPWIDTERRIAGILLMDHRLTDAAGTYFELKRLAREAVDRGVSTEPASRESPLAIEAVWPNPARTRTVVSYAGDRAGSLALAVVDALGRRVLSLERHALSPGGHQVSLDLRGLAPGAYRIVLSDGRQTTSQPLVVIR